MNNYLSKRANKYVRETLSASSASRYNSINQYRALLKRVESIGLNIEDSVNFLNESSPEILEALEGAVSALESKLQIIRDSAKFISKTKFETRLISDGSDISVIDISRGEFSNMSYSVTDHGIVMNSKHSIHIK